MGPQLAGLTKQHGDKVVVLKINVDRQRALAQRAGVRSIPDTRLYFSGRELERRVGGQSLTQLGSLVLRHADKLPSQQESGNLNVVSSSTQERSAEPSIIPVSQSAGITPRKENNAVPDGPLERGEILPMDNDWLPPGVTRE